MLHRKGNVRLTSFIESSLYKPVGVITSCAVVRLIQTLNLKKNTMLKYNIIIALARYKSRKVW